MSKTIFERICAKEIPATLVYEDEQVVAFRDINPQAPVHVLVVPVRHIPDLESATETDVDIVGRMFQAAARVASDLRFAKNGYRLVLNNGGGAGQIVPHLHLHVMSGRRFDWPPG